MSTVTVTVAVSLLLGLAAGVAMHRSDYCLAGMFRDLFLFRNSFMLRTLLLLVAVSAVLFEGGRLTGVLRPYPFPGLGSPSLTNVVGGGAFGVGMVLAGGCVVGTLYRMGAGSVVSASAFAGLVAGSFLYAEFHPWWSGVREATLFWRGKVTLSQLLGVPPVVPAAALAFAAAVPLARWANRGGLTAGGWVDGFVQPWKAALALAVIGFLSWAAVGMPMGITTSYTKWGAALAGMLFPDHVGSLAFLKGVPVDYTHPLTGGRMTGGPGPGWDGIAAVQYPLIAGIVLGSALSAVSLGEWRVRFRVPGRQLAAAFTGGAVMGLASRMAPACNVWHLLGGLPILALQSIFFTLGLLPGAWLGTRLLVRYVLPGQPVPR